MIIQDRNMGKVGRHREGEETREKVLAAARALIAENGYSATSISMISKASGVKPASIYWAFESKEGLLAAVLERAAADFFEANKQTHVRRPTSISGAIRVWAQAIAAEPDFLGLLIVLSTERKSGDPQILRAAHGIREKSREGIERFLAPLVDVPSERARKAVLHDLSRLSIMLFDGAFVSMQLEPRESSIDHVADLVADAVEGAAQKLISKASERKETRHERTRKVSAR